MTANFAWKDQLHLRQQGVDVDQSLMFSEHIGRICKRAGKKLNALGRMSDMLSTEERLTLVRSFILCHFNFCPTVCTFCGVTDTKR